MNTESLDRLPAIPATPEVDVTECDKFTKDVLEQLSRGFRGYHNDTYKTDVALQVMLISAVAMAQQFGIAVPEFLRPLRSVCLDSVVRVRQQVIDAIPALTPDTGADSSIHDSLSQLS